MSKVICDICGTSYPDTADRCPICGYSRDLNGDNILDNPVQEPEAPAAEAVREEIKETPKAAPKAAPTGSAGAVKIEAPMPGTVTKVVAKVGDSVKAGDTLIAFEAMKMEQEIKAPQDGVIASVNVSQGASINQGDLLISMN